MRIVLLFFSLVIVLHCHAQQKVKFKLTLSDTNSRTAADYLFKVKLINSGFDRYWVQDTSYLIAGAAISSLNLIHPMIWRKEGGKYRLYENQNFRSGPLRDKCLDSCCNCIIISKGDSITFNIKLLKPYKFEKGQFKMQAYLSPPLNVCNGCDQIVELESNYVYFTVRDSL